MNMNREILFRGKRKDNGEWTFGSLVIHKDILWKNQKYYYIETDTGEDRLEIIPETISQYTGLDDKNGKQIFEGDIIKYVDEKTSYTVMFDPTGYWCLDGNGARNSEMLIYFDDYKYIEVIGNIYENEKLLRKEVK